MNAALAWIILHKSASRSVALFSGCLAFFLLGERFAPENPLLGGDSLRYIDFHSEFTAGYPMFLKAVGLFDNKLRTLPAVQLFIFCGAAFLFSMGIGRLTGRLWCSIAVLILLLGNYEVAKYSFWVLSDGPFISLLAAMLGTLAFWLATKRSIWIALASALLGAAISVRPQSSPLLMIFPVLYICAQYYRFDQRSLTLALMVFPAAIVISLSFVAYHQWHGSWKPQTVLGKNLLGRATPLADGSEPSTRPARIAAVAKVGATYREGFAVGENWMDRALLRAPLYGYIRHNLDVLREDSHSALFADESETRDHAFTTLAFDIIRAHKLDYIRSVAENYGALWYIPELLSDEDAARIQHVIIASRLPTRSIPAPRPWPVVVTMHLFQLCIFLISIIVLVALPEELIRGHRPNLELWFGFAAAIALHASILVVAAFNETKPRLLLDTWPLEVLLAVIASIAVSRIIVQNANKFVWAKSREAQK